MAVVSVNLGDCTTAVSLADRCISFEPDPNSESDWERGMVSEPYVLDELKNQAQAIKDFCNQ